MYKICIHIEEDMHQISLAGYMRHWYSGCLEGGWGTGMGRKLTFVFCSRYMPYLVRKIYQKYFKRKFSVATK